MVKLLGAKAGKLTITDALMIAGTKVLSERLLATVIGDASIMSGGIKLLGAGLVRGAVGGKMGDIFGTALVVDGAEDVVTAVFPQISGGLFGGVSRQVELI